MPITSAQFPFTGIMIALAPQEAGVYVLWRESDMIYVGRAAGGRSTICSRLIDHYSGLNGPCTQRATHYGWEISPNPEQREVELLEEYRGQFQRAPRCNTA